MARVWRLGLLATGILIAGCSAPTGAAEMPTPVFAVSAEGDGNEIKVNVEDGTAIADVRSRRGIGSATVELVSGTLPENIVIRLHLKGLEQFRLVYDQTAIIASVSSGEGGSVGQSVGAPDGDERPIAPGSPFWVAIRIVPDQATPYVPIEVEYFEITLPDDFLQGEHRSFSIRWIDFYR